MSEPAPRPRSAPAMERFLGALDAADRELLAALDSPASIQAFLDSIPYSSDKFYRAPCRVFSDRRAHAVAGALVGGAALRRRAFPPLVVDLYADRDDDHMLALWQRDGCWGALAKA